VGSLKLYTLVYKLFLFVALLVTGCGRKVELKPVVRPNYSFIHLADGSAFVISRTEAGGKEGIKEVCAGPCSVDEWKLWILHKPKP
jgi:hypothetical protein